MNSGTVKRFLSGLTATEYGGVKTLEISFSGLFDDIATLQNSTCKIGATTLPDVIDVTTEAAESVDGYICEGSTLRLGEGGTAELVTRWRSRNERETAEECAAGLLSRTISVRRIERQETIEHYAARSGGGEDGTAEQGESFSEIYFNLWRQEADPVVRAACRPQSNLSHLRRDSKFVFIISCKSCLKKLRLHSSASLRLCGKFPFSRQLSLWLRQWRPASE